MKEFSFIDYLKESKSKLLDIFAKEFGQHTVFSKSSFELNDNIAKQIFNVFKDNFFEKQIKDIPVYCMSYNEICEELETTFNSLKDNENKKFNQPPFNIYGLHRVTCLTNCNTFKRGDTLVFKDDDEIFINKTQLNNVSFSLIASTICHEMIHYYDRLYGEYVKFYIAELLTHISYDFHNTNTFESLKNKAQKDYIRIFQTIRKGQTIKMSDQEAVELALSALEENENMPSIDNCKNIIPTKDGTMIFITY